MANSKLRRQLAWHAARLLIARKETDWFRARSRAIRELVRGWVRPDDLPQRTDIQAQLTRIAQSTPDAEYEQESDQDLFAENREEDLHSFFSSLLYPLENVMLPRRTHPQGDALYHSLQVFDLARNALPYDEEFLLAALLHAVGESLDRQDPIEAALQVLGSTVSERTAWLIAFHEIAQGCLDGTIGIRARRRLERHESFEELMMLAGFDQEGRQRGVPVPTVDEALKMIAEIGDAYEQ